ncbi:MAG: purine-nucleoside phosphorylase [Planctomycetes bacterium]|nr:purine-nucleoside phosphorylase [Planctomycetota bacterium]
MIPLVKKLEEAVAFLKTKVTAPPKVAIILGTGLDALANAVTDQVKVDYADIPHFPKSHEGRFHKGDFLFGKIGDTNVVCMQGRFHLYEGYTLDEITLPIRVMRRLGAEYLIISNACGGMNPNYRKGDIMLIEDHINFTGVNPLVGPHDDKLGIRFPDMIEPYSHELCAKTKAIALDLKIAVREGVYVGVLGPCLETRAEYRMLRSFGADVVGMSTVTEAIVAVQENFKILGVSIVTDICLPDALEPAKIEHIIEAANEAEPRAKAIIERLVKDI